MNPYFFLVFFKTPQHSFPPSSQDPTLSTAGSPCIVDSVTLPWQTYVISLMTTVYRSRLACKNYAETLQIQIKPLPRPKTKEKRETPRQEKERQKQMPKTKADLTNQKKSAKCEWRMEKQRKVLQSHFLIVVESPQVAIAFFVCDKREAAKEAGWREREGERKTLTWGLGGESTCTGAAANPYFKVSQPVDRLA